MRGGGRPGPTPNPVSPRFPQRPQEPEREKGGVGSTVQPRLSPDGRPAAALPAAGPLLS